MIIALSAPALAGPAQSSSLESQLTAAGPNRDELGRALASAPKAQRDGVRFLIENMPPPDLRHMSAASLLANCALAYSALQTAPWRTSIPHELFLNDILPYACLNERRDAWRGRLRSLSLPLITACKSPAAAAQRINQRIFTLVHAGYSTERKRPDQSPLETMESGKATCTGLSILLADACRSVGIPARVVGTPLWANLRGNHTWVEIWDGGWHFTGAAEPDAAGLDRGWFTHDAGEARPDIPRHAIYATSYRRTGLAFPMVWSPDTTWVPAVNVTQRYLAKTQAAAAVSRVAIRVVDGAGKRIAAHVALQQADGKSRVYEGVTRAGRADLNDLLSFELPRMCPPATYTLTVDAGGRSTRRQLEAGGKANELIEAQAP